MLVIKSCMVMKMLVIVRKYRDLNLGQLFDVYEESCIACGARDYPALSEAEQFLRARDDLYQYLRESFFFNDDCFCAFWELNGHYVSALRVEPYRDGVILSALETAPELRGRGYAKTLVQNLLDYHKDYEGFKVYSHIDRNSYASIAVHLSCGFQKVSDRAVYLDGSVSDRADTYLFTVK